MCFEVCRGPEANVRGGYELSFKPEVLLPRRWFEGDTEVGDCGLCLGTSSFFLLISLLGGGKVVRGQERVVRCRSRR